MGPTSDLNLLIAQMRMLVEYEIAVSKHGDWEHVTMPQALSVLMEEVGEAAKAFNDLSECDTDKKKVFIEEFATEVAQVGAVALRMLAELQRRKLI